MASVRVILANAAECDWEIHHVDIKSAYLNAPLKEMVYMKPLHSVLKPGQEGKVCCLKTLYMDLSKLVESGTKNLQKSWSQI